MPRLLPSDPRLAADVLPQYLFVPSDFYEPLDRIEPQGDFLAVVQSILPPYWREIRDGIWYQIIPPHFHLPLQGWKIHVSATAATAEATLQSVATTCATHGVSFKFACDEHLLVLLNSKTWPRSSAGKFITIYPSSEEQFRLLLHELYSKLKSSDGPYILSDNRFRDCKALYYRYGGFEQMTAINCDGLLEPTIVAPDGHRVRDRRTASFTPPAWVKDPFDTGSQIEADLTLQHGRYQIDKVLTFSNVGGVYLGLDNETGRRVVLKEARASTGFDLTGRDAALLREKEWRLLNRLKGTSVVPQPIDLFWEWEHLFLVESYIDGSTILQFIAEHNPIYWPGASEEELASYLRRIITLGANLARVLKAIHGHDIVVGDLAHDNVIVNLLNQSVTLVDLEGAVELGVDEGIPLWTPGYAITEQRLRRAAQPQLADDYYALGSLLMTLIHPVHDMLDLQPDVHRIFLKDLQRDYDLPPELVNIILSLVDPHESKRPRPSIVESRLSQVSVGAINASEPPTVATEQLEEVVRGVASFVLSAATPHRRDRLFPADPNMINPLDIAHGAFGVIYAIKRLTGSVPEPLLEWAMRRHDMRLEVNAPGLYVGLSGMAWVLSELGYLDEAIGTLRQAEQHPLLFECSDLFSGVSGFGLTCLHLWLCTREQRFLDRAAWVGDWLLRTKQHNERGCFWPFPEESTVIGYGHGSCGPALFLLYLHFATGDHRFLTVGRGALEHDLSYSLPHGTAGSLSFPRYATETIRVPYWYTGSAGVGTVLLRYALVTKDEDLVAILQRVIPDTRRKYTLFPGLFNGLAGLGNFLLDCYQLAGDEHFLVDAHQVAQGILLYRINSPHGVAFPGDNLVRISTDFGSGCAGIGLFLHRLLRQSENFNFVLDALLPLDRELEDKCC